MRCLLTGASGFIGSHLAEYLLAQGETVYGLSRSASKFVTSLGENFKFFECDILDRERVARIISDTHPEVVFHLAAQSLPKISWQNVEQTFNVNVLGTLYLLDSIRQAGLDPVIEVMCSSAEYRPTCEGATPIREDHPLEPSSPYALSKIAQDHLCVLYHRAYGMRIIRVRPFFIIGPRKSGDACSDFARGIVEIERGQKDVLEAGNLEAVRDFLDVRDAVAAFWLLTERGEPGEAYNVCSGEGHSMRNVLSCLISLALGKIEVRQDSRHLRPLDEPMKIGDNSKLRALGWKPRIGIKKTIRDIIAFWRTQSDDILG